MRHITENESNSDSQINLDEVSFDLEAKLKSEAFKDQHDKYLASKAQIEQKLIESNEINVLTDFLTKNRIVGVKYNYALDEEVQKFSTFDCFIELQQAGQWLKIINREPIDRTEYVLEADQFKINEIKAKKKAEMQ